jgi:hypothetical protein
MDVRRPPGLQTFADGLLKSSKPRQLQLQLHVCFSPRLRRMKKLRQKKARRLPGLLYREHALSARGHA